MTRLVLLAALLVACSKKDNAGPPCEKVVDRMLELTKQMIPGHDPGSLGDRTQMIEQCKQRNMSAEVRSCIVAAKSLDELSTCRAKDKPAGTRPPAPSPTPAPPPGPAPTPAPTRPLPTGSNGSGSG